MNPWAVAWALAVETMPAPARLRELRFLQWSEFAVQVVNARELFVETLVGSLYAGDAWILKGAFPEEFMRALAVKTRAWTGARPSSFHKMLDGAPDFHRLIDLEAGKAYSIHGCKHSAYFYRWNDDPLGVLPEITARWRIAKLAMGLRADEYERNTPRDGVVDRVQVVRYPPSIGYLEPHADAHEHQRLFFSAYMSKRGADYSGGGFYFVGADDRAIEVEGQIDVGDVCIGYAGLYHGVAPCDRGVAPDWNKADGRWFLSMYSNASDEMPARHTAKPVKIAVPGVLP